MEDLIGFEVEMEVLKWKKRPYIHPYHKGEYADEFWKFETDGSLESLHGGEMVEAITCPLLNKDEVETAIQHLQRFVESFHINGTCGLHAHFSSEEFEPTKVSPFLLASALRTDFFKRLKASGLSSETMKRIRRRYYRYYAKRVSFSNEIGVFECRYYSVNLTFPYLHKRFEWRSPNATGVSSFNELKTIMFAIYDSLTNVVKRGQRKMFFMEFDENASFEDVFASEDMAQVIEI